MITLAALLLVVEGKPVVRSIVLHPANLPLFAALTGPSLKGGVDSTLIAKQSTPPGKEGKPRSGGVVNSVWPIVSNRLPHPITDIHIVQQSIQALTDVMVYDITSPPVASRNYVYSILAFYEAARFADPKCASFSGKLKGLDSLPAMSGKEPIDWLVAGTTAFYKTAYAFVFSKPRFQASWDSVMTEMHKRPITPELYDRSSKYGEEVAGLVIKWARADHYAQTRSMQRFTQSKDLTKWQQTPPDYLEAIEPNWNRLRPMTLDKASQFTIAEPPPFNTEAFRNECKIVYETTLHLTKEQREQAGFWDCNPFAMETTGHFMFGVKKMSPGSHWIGITAIAVKQQKQSLAPALRTYALVSVAIFDAFLATWTEKYTSNYIRPVTAIQRLIAPTWQPLLQTPPFPEYPSGHSVVSMASATMLTKIFGEHFRYTDDCERAYGLSDRHFNSFYDAANEAARSRLYGGIHFRPAIENGKELGRKVAGQVISKLF